MKSPIVLGEKVKVSLADEVMRFGWRLGIAAASIIGVWALCTLMVVCVKLKPLAMLLGYFSALVGW